MEPLGCCLAKTKSLDFLSTGEWKKFNTISIALSKGHLKHVLYLSDGLKSGRKLFLAYYSCQFYFRLLCRKKENLYENDILLHAADTWSPSMCFYSAEFWPQQCRGLRRYKPCYPQAQWRYSIPFLGRGKGSRSN